MTGYYRRHLEILRRLLPFAIGFLRDRRRYLLFGSPRTLPQQAHRDRAARLTHTFLELGPTFIKAGQVLSTRPDLVPAVYADALGTLQDQVPESKDADPVAVIHDELGPAVLDPATLTAIAGGSLAYVYAATRTDTGQRVAVKVRRPGVRHQIERDLRIIRRLVSLIGIIAPERHQYSLRNITGDFEQIILDELDFAREARMMERIRENLADDDRVHIPWADTDITTPRVLVMEYVEGVKITNHNVLRERGVDQTRLAGLIIDVYLRMGLVDGVFHADPHPGNLAVGTDDRLVLYDFGMSGELSPPVQARIRDLYTALARWDTDGLVDALIALDVLEPTVDRREIRRILDKVTESLAGQPHVTWREIIAELTYSLREFPFRIPPAVMLLLRVGTVGEGVCRRLDPEFDFLAAVRTHLRADDHLARELRALIHDTRTDLVHSLPVLAGLPRRLDAVLAAVEHGDLTVRTQPSPPPSTRTLGYAIIGAGFIIAAALALPHSEPVSLLALAAGVVFLAWFLRTTPG